MGAVYSGIPTKLATDLKHKYGLKIFVESGLVPGITATSLWAESLFDAVISIEINRNNIATFRQRYPKSKVTVIEGDSADKMTEVVYSLPMPALFWLDGHTDDYTPIMDELASINVSPLPHVVMIDDWRMFGTCPAWPSKADVIAYATNGKRWAYDVDDVLVAEPQRH